MYEVAVHVRWVIFEGPGSLATRNLGIIPRQYTGFGCGHSYWIVQMGTTIATPIRYWSPFGTLQTLHTLR
jgi:hypothetical protein